MDPLAQVTKAALLNDCTLFCAWSPLVSPPHINHTLACSLCHVMLIMAEAGLLIARSLSLPRDPFLCLEIWASHQFSDGSGIFALRMHIRAYAAA